MVSPDFHLPWAPRCPHRDPLRDILDIAWNPAGQGQKTQMPWSLAAEFLGPASGNFLGFVACFVFVSELPGDDSANLNFEIAATRANRDFPEKLRGLLSRE